MQAQPVSSSWPRRPDRRKATQTTLERIIDTDLEGQERLESIVKTGRLWVHQCVNALGELLVNTDHEQLSRETFEKIGFLMIGLSKLGESIDNAAISVEQTGLALAKAQQKG